MLLGVTVICTVLPGELTTQAFMRTGSVKTFKEAHRSLLPNTARCLLELKGNQGHLSRCTLRVGDRTADRDEALGRRFHRRRGAMGLPFAGVPRVDEYASLGDECFLAGKQGVVHISDATLAAMKNVAIGSREFEHRSRILDLGLANPIELRKT